MCVVLDVYEHRCACACGRMDVCMRMCVYVCMQDQVRASVREREKEIKTKNHSEIGRKIIKEKVAQMINEKQRETKKCLSSITK